MRATRHKGRDKSWAARIIGIYPKYLSIVLLRALVIGRGFHDTEREIGQLRSFYSYHRSSCIFQEFTGSFRLLCGTRRMVPLCSAEDGVVGTRAGQGRLRARQLDPAPRSLNRHRLLSCAQQTPRRGLIDKGNIPLLGVQKWLPEV